MPNPHLFVKPGDFMRKGQVVAEIRDMFDNVLEELASPAEGVIIRCRLLPTVATGARIYDVSETDIGERWENRKLPELESQITLSGHHRPRS